MKKAKSINYKGTLINIQKIKENYYFNFYIILFNG